MKLHIQTQTQENYSAHDWDGKGDSMKRFIVWVGGVADYEGNSLNQAKAVYNEWIEQNYDDVILEEITV